MEDGLAKRKHKEKRVKKLLHTEKKLKKYACAKLTCCNNHVIASFPKTAVWYIRHARTAVDIVQRCVVYFKRPHENICASLLTRFLTREFIALFLATLIRLYLFVHCFSLYFFSMSSTNDVSVAPPPLSQLKQRE